MIRPPIVERSVDLGDVRLNVASAGSGRPVILLHGFPDSWRLWRHQTRLLAATGYRVIAPDLRGFGRSTSSRPLDVADYRMSVLVSDIAGLLDSSGAWCLTSRCPRKLIGASRRNARERGGQLALIRMPLRTSGRAVGTVAR